MKSGSQSVKSHTLRDMMAAKNGQKHNNQNQKSWLRPVRDLRPKRGWGSSWGWRDIIEGLFNWSSTSPKEPMLHLSVCPCTGYQLQLASSSRHWCLHIEQPQAQHPPTSTHYYEFTSWWNDLPTPIRNAGSLSNFKQQLKTHLFQLYLTT